MICLFACLLVYAAAMRSSRARARKKARLEIKIPSAVVPPGHGADGCNIKKSSYDKTTNLKIPQKRNLRRIPTGIAVVAKGMNSCLSFATPAGMIHFYARGTIFYAQNDNAIEAKTKKAVSNVVAVLSLEGLKRIKS